MSSDYKMILLSEDSKTKVRYRKQNDAHWNTLELDETNTDLVIDTLLERLKNGD